MPRPKIEDEFTGFHDWLIEQGYNPSSANTYTSALRAVHKELGNSISDQEAVEEFFSQKMESSPSSVPRLLTSLKRGRDWFLETQGLLIALPAKKALQRKPKEKSNKELHPEVREAVRVLNKNAVPLTAFNRLCWYHVNIRDLNQAYIHVEIPGKENEYWRVPGEAVRVLWKHFNPQGNLALPLIPKVPGSTAPYSYYSLRMEVMKFSPEEVEAMIAPAGSALGGHPKPMVVEANPSQSASEEGSEARMVDPNDVDFEPEEEEPQRTTKQLLSDLLGYDPNAQD